MKEQSHLSPLFGIGKKMVYATREGVELARLGAFEALPTPIIMYVMIIDSCDMHVTCNNKWNGQKGKKLERRTYEVQDERLSIDLLRSISNKQKEYFTVTNILS